MYKLYVRPHLDYGDIVYHRHDPEMLLSFTRKLEQTQYLAALAVTSAWRGTNRQSLYEELGWESLYQRRWYRRLCYIFKLKNSHNPEYLYAEMPPERQVMYNLRSARLYEQSMGRTVRFSNTYFQNTLSEWNSLTLDIRNSTSIAKFKRKLLGIIRPAQKPIHNINDIARIRLLTKFRLNFSALNEHKFRHNFECLDPICGCGTSKEDNEHFLLHCPLFELQRADLLGQLGDLPGIDIVSLDSKTICELLLLGSPSLNVTVNRIILEATISFIKSTQ